MEAVHVIVEIFLRTAQFYQNSQKVLIVCQNLQIKDKTKYFEVSGSSVGCSQEYS